MVGIKKCSKGGSRGLFREKSIIFVKEHHLVVLQMNLESNHRG